MALLALSMIALPTIAPALSVPAAWNPIDDILNKIREAIVSAINWIADQISSALWSAASPLFQALAKLVLGNPVPEYGDWGSVSEVSWYEIRVPEMMDLYGKSKIASYILLPIPIVAGAMAVGLEGFGLVREGEGMLMLKKSLWIAILIPLSMILYEYSVHLLSALTHYLCPPDTLSWYLGIGFGAIGLLGLVIDPLILMFILVVAIAGAIRILAVATLAAILPILLVLGLIPKIGGIAVRLIEALIGLVLVQPVAGAMIAMASAIAGGISGSSFVDAVVKVMIAIASLAIPLIAPMYIGRSGFAGFAASTLLGYTAYPMVAGLRAQIASSTLGVRGHTLGWGISAGARAGRYIYHKARALPRIIRHRTSG